MIKKPLYTNQNELIALARDIGAEGIADALINQFNNEQLYASKPFVERMGKCLAAEREHINNRISNRLLKNSKLPQKLYIAQFVVNEKNGLTADVLETLSSHEYLDDRQNIIISGLTGIGKTALACAAGMEACRNGYSTFFIKAEELRIRLATCPDVDFPKLSDRLARYKLLIIDDVGHSKLEGAALIRLHCLLDKRYGLTSTLITSQLRKKDLSDLFIPCPSSDAIINRVVTTAHEIYLQGPSWRGTPNEFKGE